MSERRIYKTSFKTTTFCNSFSFFFQKYFKDYLIGSHFMTWIQPWHSTLVVLSQSIKTAIGSKISHLQQQMKKSWYIDFPVFLIILQSDCFTEGSYRKNNSCKSVK